MTVLAPSGARAAGTRRTGGTLRLYGDARLDCLDPAAAYARPARDAVRLCSRQLVGFEPRVDPRDWQAIAPAADAALAVPSTYNAGLGASHRCYVFHLRRDVLWDTVPPRPVTAHEFVRGLKRIASPAVRQPALTYLESAIRGMAEFRAGYAAAADPARPAELAAYQDGNEIAGVFALDDETLVIELVRPAPDFLSILALPCASAAPAEYDAFVPGSPELDRNLRSNGPYRVARCVPGAVLALERNPAWRAASDPLRGARVERIEIVRERAEPAAVAARIAAGGADLPWVEPLAAPSHAGAAAQRTDAAAAAAVSYPPEPFAHAGATAAVSYSLDPYLAFNFAGGAPALRDVRVRRAIAAAVDRAAIAAVYARCGGGGDVRVAHTLVPPGTDAHRDAAGPVHGDAGRARALLAEAGHASDLALTAVHRRGDRDAAVARAYASAIERAGIAVRVAALGEREYDRAVGGGGWDLTAGSWSADWRYRNGRAFLQPLFASGASANRGGYASAEVDRLIERALDAAVEPPATADAAWSEVERRLLDDVAAVPLLFRAPALPQRHGERLLDLRPMPASGYALDLATLSLA